MILDFTISYLNFNKIEKTIDWWSSRFC